MSIQPGGEVWKDRRRLKAAVGHALQLLGDGATADAAEVEGVDFKEEAGRRGRGGAVLAGQAKSEAVASQLADEVACLANSPGGGALVDLAPAVEEQLLPDGTRLLILLVAESREPVENTSGQLRWRVGTSCCRYHPRRHHRHEPATQSWKGDE